MQDHLAFLEEVLSIAFHIWMFEDSSWGVPMIYDCLGRGARARKFRTLCLLCTSVAIQRGVRLLYFNLFLTFFTSSFIQIEKGWKRAAMVCDVCAHR